MVRHLNEVVSEGGVIIDTQQLNTKVLDIPTFSLEYKEQIQQFMKEQQLGETLNDWLNNAKQKGIQIFQVPYTELLKQIGEKIGITKISMLTKMINVLTIGISFALLKYDKKLVENAVKALLNRKSLK